MLPVCMLLALCLVGRFLLGIYDLVAQANQQSQTKKLLWSFVAKRCSCKSAKPRVDFGETWKQSHLQQKLQEQ